MSAAVQDQPLLELRQVARRFGARPDWLERLAIGAGINS